MTPQAEPESAEERAERAADNFDCATQIRLTEEQREVFMLNVLPEIRAAQQSARKQAFEEVVAYHEKLEEGAIRQHNICAHACDAETAKLFGYQASTHSTAAAYFRSLAAPQEGA